jgi:hypothetical protein
MAEGDVFLTSILAEELHRQSEAHSRAKSDLLAARQKLVWTEKEAARLEGICQDLVARLEALGVPDAAIDYARQSISGGLGAISSANFVECLDAHAEAMRGYETCPLRPDG